MPVHTDHSGYQCEAHFNTEGVLCNKSADDAVRCTGRTFVDDTREWDEDLQELRRKRWCPKCSAEFQTREILYGPITISTRTAIDRTKARVDLEGQLHLFASQDYDDDVKDFDPSVN